jgi:hypothetical protein
MNDLKGRRHTRQARLAEVGAGGQARLASGEVRVGEGGLAGLVGARYAAGAGFGVVRVPTDEVGLAARAVDGRLSVVVDAEASPAPIPAWLAELDPAARDVARGAHDVLVAIRARLGGRA